MAESSQDRNLPASQRKITKARKQGQVARSRDLGHFAAITACVALVVATAPQAIDLLTGLLREGLRFDAAFVAQPQAMGERLQVLAMQMMQVLVPLFAVMVGVGLASSVLVGGWNFTTQPLMPDFSKMNPLTGLVRMLGKDQLLQTLKSCLLAVLLGGVGGLYLSQQWMQHAKLLAMSLPTALATGGSIVQTGCLLLCAVLGVFALIDAPLQYRALNQRLRMTKEEAKQEYKESEGSPEIKGRIKQRMREMANRRMMAAVPTADLVVMNPSHFAVALKYDENAMGAPRVVAKGADLLALRIRDLARDSKVPVLQAPPLARALYAHTEVDQEIPPRLFGAVAQVLAWVYQLREAMRRGRPHLAPLPTPEVPADLDPFNEASPLFKRKDNNTPRQEPEL